MLRAAPRVSSFCARCGGSSAHRRLSYTSSAPHRPRSERRRPSARSFCRAAAPLAPARRRIPARRRWRSCSRSRGARARTASRESPTLRPLCRPTRAGYREETDFAGAILLSSSTATMQSPAYGRPRPRAARRYLAGATDGKPGSRRARTAGPAVPGGAGRGAASDRRGPRGPGGARDAAGASAVLARNVHSNVIGLSEAG
jgi:hypothetical protein